MDNSERNDLRAIQALARKYDAKVEEIDSGIGAQERIRL